MKELNVEQMAQVEGGCLDAADLNELSLETLLTAFEFMGSWYVNNDEIC
jgi:bacteriocin-like protein